MFSRHDKFINGFVIGINSYLIFGVGRLNLDDHSLAPFVLANQKRLECF